MKPKKGKPGTAEISLGETSACLHLLVESRLEILVQTSGESTITVFGPPSSASSELQVIDR